MSGRRPRGSATPLLENRRSSMRKPTPIIARWGGDDEEEYKAYPGWFDAVVRHDNGDGTCYVVYADGAWDTHCPYECISQDTPEAAEAKYQEMKRSREPCASGEARPPGTPDAGGEEEEKKTTPTTEDVPRAERAAGETLLVCGTCTFNANAATAETCEVCGEILARDASPGDARDAPLRPLPRDAAPWRSDARDAPQSESHRPPEAPRAVGPLPEARRSGAPSPERAGPEANGSKACEVRKIGAEEWRLFESQSDAVAACPGLTTTALSNMLNRMKPHDVYEARRPREATPSPTLSASSDADTGRELPEVPSSKACEVREIGTNKWRLFNSQSDAVAACPGLSMWALSLMLKGTRDHDVYEARRRTRAMPDNRLACEVRVVGSGGWQYYESQRQAIAAHEGLTGYILSMLINDATSSHPKFEARRATTKKALPESRFRLMEDSRASLEFVSHDVRLAPKRAEKGATYALALTSEDRWYGGLSRAQGRVFVSRGGFGFELGDVILAIDSWDARKRSLGEVEALLAQAARSRIPLVVRVARLDNSAPRPRPPPVRAAPTVAGGLTFPERLAAMLGDGSAAGLVEWNAARRRLHLVDEAAFAADLMPRVFQKLDKIENFKRQLNRYGFYTAHPGAMDGVYKHRADRVNSVDDIAFLEATDTKRAQREMKQGTFYSGGPSPLERARLDAAPWAPTEEEEEEEEAAAAAEEDVVEEGPSPEAADAWAAAALQGGDATVSGRRELRRVVWDRSFDARRDGERVRALARALGPKLGPAASDALLRLAPLRRTADLVELLLKECGADARVADCDGARPLHFAAAADRADVATVLLDFGARLDDATLVDGRDALDLAHAHRSARCLARFLSLVDDDDYLKDAALDAPSHVLLPGPPSGRVSAEALVSEAFSLRRAARDAVDALTTGDAADQFPFNASVVDKAERLRDALEAAVAAVDDEGRVDLDADVVLAVGECAADLRAVWADEAPKRPKRPAAWAEAMRAPGVFLTSGAPVTFAQKNDFLGAKIATRTCRDEASPLYGDLEVFATADIAAGDEAAYAGVVGPAATLATTCDLHPLEQLAYWRWLVYRDDRESVLLPFVDAKANASCFVNDAVGPRRERLLHPGEGPNVVFVERGAATVVVADRDVRAGDVLRGAAQGCEHPNFKGSHLGRFPLVLADFWTSDHLSERSRSMDVGSRTRARGTAKLKRH